MIYIISYTIYRRLWSEIRGCRPAQKKTIRPCICHQFKAPRPVRKVNSLNCAVNSQCIYTTRETFGSSFFFLPPLLQNQKLIYIYILSPSLSLPAIGGNLIPLVPNVYREREYKSYRYRPTVSFWSRLSLSCLLSLTDRRTGPCAGNSRLTHRIAIILSGQLLLYTGECFWKNLCYQKTRKSCYFRYTRIALDADADRNI